MLQKLLGVCFFATILTLSYVATLHIVTNRVDALHHQPASGERSKTLRLSGPVPLRSLSDHRPVGEKRYPVTKIVKPASKPFKGESLKALSKLKKKKSKRPIASIKKLKTKKSKKR